METRAFKRARLASQRAELGLASAATEGEIERMAWHVRRCERAGLGGAATPAECLAAERQQRHAQRCGRLGLAVTVTAAECGEVEKQRRQHAQRCAQLGLDATATAARCAEVKLARWCAELGLAETATAAECAELEQRRGFLAHLVSCAQQQPGPAAAAAASGLDELTRMQAAVLRLVLASMAQPRLGAASPGGGLDHDMLQSVGEHLTLRSVSIRVRFLDRNDGAAAAESRLFVLPRDSSLNQVISEYASSRNAAPAAFRFTLAAGARYHGHDLGRLAQWDREIGRPLPKPWPHVVLPSPGVVPRPEYGTPDDWGLENGDVINASWAKRKHKCRMSIN